METLKQKTARGLFWGGMNTMVQQVIGLLFGIILGRLLAPSDYGMMAIISVFSLVAVALQDSGFKVALANEKAPTHADYNAVFWFNILMGIALYAALFLSAPLIGRWYNTPQVVPLRLPEHRGGVDGHGTVGLAVQEPQGQADSQGVDGRHHAVGLRGRRHGPRRHGLLVAGHAERGVRGPQHRAALLPPTSTRPRLARCHQGLLLPLHLRMALLAV